APRAGGPLIVAIGFQTARHRSNPGNACKDSLCPRDPSLPLTKAVKNAKIRPRLTKDLGWEGAAQMNVRIKLGVVAASVAALALSACGSSSLSGEAGGGGSAPSVSVSQNA